MNAHERDGMAEFKIALFALLIVAALACLVYAMKFRDPLTTAINALTPEELARLDDSLDDPKLAPPHLSKERVRALIRASKASAAMQHERVSIRGWLERHNYPTQQIDAALASADGVTMPETKS
jgi:hypothetical protein